MSFERYLCNSDTRYSNVWSANDAGERNLRAATAGTGAADALQIQSLHWHAKGCALALRQYLCWPHIFCGILWIVEKQQVLKTVVSQPMSTSRKESIFVKGLASRSSWLRMKATMRV